MTALDGGGKRYNPGAILAFVCLGQFMIFLDISVVNLALPSVQRGLHLTNVDLNYVVTAYATVIGGFLLLSGKIADAYGRRRGFQIGMTLFALASLVSGLAHNGATLITARGFQGLGASFVAPSALSILTTTFEEGPARTKALGVWGSLTGMASILGVIIGGALAQGPGWRWIFYINIPIGLGTALLAPRIIPESKATKPVKRFDFAGAIALTGGLLLLIFTLGQATIVGWNTPRTIGSLAGAGALLIAFVIIESIVKEPMIPLRIFRLKTMRVANLSALLVFGTFGAMFFFFSLFMQQAYGYSPLRAGVAYLPLAGCVAIGATIASQMITKLNARPVLLTGLIMVVGALLLLARSPINGSYPADLLPAFLIVGLGCGMCYVTLQVAAFTGITGEEAGIGAGLIATAQDGGSAIGVAIASTIAYSGLAARLAAAHGNQALIRTAQGAANHRAFIFAACYCFAAVVLAALFMPRAPKPTPAATGTIDVTAPAVPVQEPQPR